MGMKQEITRKTDLLAERKSNPLVSYESSSDSETPDDQWDFSFLESDAEESDEGKRLTALVRSSYLSHLHRTLSENCNKWLKKNGTKEEKMFSDTDISKYAMLLERKALRASIMANIYQRSMVQVMRDVKKYTEQCVLFKDLIPEKDLNRSKWSNKETQTDSEQFIKRISSVQIIDKAKGFQYSPNGNNIKDAVAMVPPLQKNNLFSLETFELNNGSNFTNGVSVSTSPKECKLSSLDICKSLLESMNTPEEESCLETNKLESSSNMCEKRKLFPTELPQDKCESPPVKKVCKRQKTPSKPRTSLDDRLSRLATLFGDSEASQDCEIVEEHVQDKQALSIHGHKPKPQVFDWHIEYIAQMCNLNKILLESGADRRCYVEKRFKDLFGGAIDPVTNVCYTEVTYCRKRIADMVVSELTPFYVSCRIGSKHIFKQLAKHITDNILKKTYAPEMYEVIRSVNEIFVNGRSVMTTEDLSLVVKTVLI